MRRHATPNRIVQDINDRVELLMNLGLAADQQWTIQKSISRQIKIVTFPNAENLSVTLKENDYRILYDLQVRQRMFNVRMRDGALLQISYEFSKRSLQWHRLAFLPSPIHKRFQDVPDTYLKDSKYGDIFDGNIIPFPVRFDYDIRKNRQQTPEHPASHLTLGQYKECRIPVSAPIAPHQFIDFVIRYFYHTSTRRYADNLPPIKFFFEDSIAPEERQIVHVVIPGGTAH